MVPQHPNPHEEERAGLERLTDEVYEASTDPLKTHSFLVLAERSIWRVVESQTHDAQTAGTGTLLPRVALETSILKAEDS